MKIEVESSSYFFFLILWVIDVADEKAVDVSFLDGAAVDASEHLDPDPEEPDEILPVLVGIPVEVLFGLFERLPVGPEVEPIGIIGSFVVEGGDDFVHRVSLLSPRHFVEVFHTFHLL